MNFVLRRTVLSLPGFCIFCLLDRVPGIVGQADLCGADLHDSVQSAFDTPRSVGPGLTAALRPGDRRKPCFQTEARLEIVHLHRFSPAPAGTPSGISADGRRRGPKGEHHRYIGIYEYYFRRETDASQDS